MRRLLLLLCMVGCSGVDADSRVTKEPEIVDGKADAGRWKSKDDETSVWLDIWVESEPDGTWSTTGRFSRNIKSLEASVDGEEVEANILSARKFSLLLTEDELKKVAAGFPVAIDAETSKGTTSVEAVYATRFTEFTGDGDLFLFESLNPIIVGAETKLRGRVALPDGWLLSLATTDVGYDAEVGPDAENRWVFDTSLDALPLFLGTPMTFLAADVESQRLVKTATPQLKLAILRTEPQPVVCHPDVESCLIKHSPSDTERCGYASQIRACLPFPVMQFSKDLAVAVEEYYEQHADEIPTREGRTLGAALTKISPTKVGFDQAPLRNFNVDRPDAIIVYHAGVIFRDSPHVWYGAYAPDGTLIEIRLVNDILR